MPWIRRHRSSSASQHRIPGPPRRVLADAFTVAAGIAAAAVAPLAASDFVRGDVDTNGRIEISDPIALLDFFFVGVGRALPCRDAGDANDDGESNISDAVWLLSFLFIGGPPPAAPFPECGADPSPGDRLDCASFPPCASAPTEFERLVAMYGILDTICGTGELGDAGLNLWQPSFEGAMAVDVELSRPHNALSDDAGTIYIADKEAHGIRKITLDGRLHTVAGTNEIGDDGDDPGPAVERRLSNPNGLWVHGDGTIYILDTGNGKVRRVDLAGEMTTLFAVPGGILVGRGLWVSDDEQLAFVAAGDRIWRWTPDEGPEPFSTGYVELGNIAVDPAGRLFVTDRRAHFVYTVDDDGERTPVAGNGFTSGGGSGETALETGLYEPRGIFFHPLGGFFIGEHEGSRVWYVDQNGVIHLFIDGFEEAHSGDGERFDTPGAKLSEVRNVTVAADGSVLITEHDAGFIRIVRRTTE